MTTTEVPLRGPYDLREVALMGFGHRDESSFDGVMRLGFCVDGDYESQVGVALRQAGDVLAVTVEETAGPPVDPARIVAQAARVVSADQDGEAYADLCRADPMLAPVFARAPGFRPANFYSPYEAAVWSIVSARRPRSQGIVLRQRLAETYGTVLTVAGQPVPVVPTPSRLLAVDQLPGLPADRIPRLHAIAEAAQRGDLAVDHLTALGVDAARTELQRLPGIGPFYSSLITVRSCGLTDVLATEPQVLKHLEAAYGRRVDAEELEQLAEAWRPWRTWVTVMLRALSGRADAGG
ncbi:DNA-3-methyladenine glycosylase [Microlunatus aurantiacus]|uniref:DNA-3-methyladenine glycosylase n=1 Tax=Microlunatus aurantiacus TaxID=446786 RepID=A0ABP7D5V4_9ACTN